MLCTTEWMQTVAYSKHAHFVTSNNYYQVQYLRVIESPFSVMRMSLVVEMELAFHCHIDVTAFQTAMTCLMRLTVK
jgi:hypothetical protein